MSKSMVWILESLTAGVISGDVECLNEARECLHLISDVEDRAAMDDLTRSVLELVNQILREQGDF